MGCCQSVDSDSEPVRDYPRPSSTPVSRNHWTTPTFDRSVRHPVSRQNDYVQTTSNFRTTQSTRPYNQSVHSENRRTNTCPPVNRVVTRPPTNTQGQTNRQPSKNCIAPTRDRSRNRKRTNKKPGEKIDAETPRENVCDINPKPIISGSAWDIHELLAETKRIDKTSARNIVQLFEHQNTIPFICRYRRDLINQKITPDKLREIKNAYAEIVSLRKRSEIVIDELEEAGIINDEIREQILCVKTVKELEFVHSFYKRPKRTAQELGLAHHAKHLLYGFSAPVSVHDLMDHAVMELDTIWKVKNVLCESISQQISTNISVLNELRRLQNKHQFTLKCTKTEIDNDSIKTTEQDQAKYEKYFEFLREVRHMKAHQILAINRGEKKGFLTVEIIPPDNFQSFVRGYIHATYMWEGEKYPLRQELFERAFDECYKEKLIPLVCQQIRANLTEIADKEAVQVFAKNLKQLLLMPPLKGEPILGIDPGFKHGCKLALISETADLLDDTVLHPHRKHPGKEREGYVLAGMLERHRCKVIALGNGKACRETESWLKELFDTGILDGKSINYAIVSEQGASEYSCSEEARKEFPNLDVNSISAVSIARRLNDPLSEYTKIEPRHLGIGMYQHDTNESFLMDSFKEVVTECVSFVGVDINTAGLSLLKHIAGLNEDRAKNIIQYRQNNGSFRTRWDLLQVPGMDEKAFIQCAGFIRIEPKSVGGKVDNVLDCTWVHPESYEVAVKIIKECNLNLEDIGTPHFISTIEAFNQRNTIKSLVNRYRIPSERVRTVLAALQRELFQDYRKNFDKKLFKREITKIEDLFIGEIVTGEVRNVVHFGAFIDIGLKNNGLIPNRHMNNIKLKMGNQVSATVLDFDIPKGRVELRLDELI